MNTDVPLERLELESGPPETQSLDQLLSYLWWLLGQYYWLLLPVALLGLGGSYLWTQQQPKIYQASAKLVVHPDQPNILGENIDPSGFMGAGKRFQFARFWNTQKEVLKSRPFLERAVKRTGLLDDPQFRKILDGDLTESALMPAAIRFLTKNTTIERRRKSRVGVISAQTTDPELSARISNGIANEYLEYASKMQTGNMREVVNWFDKYVSNKGEELTDAQRQLEEFKQKHNILSLSYEDRQNLTAENRKAVNKELNQIRRKLSKKQALLAQVRKIQESDDSLTTIAGLLGKGSIQTAIDRRNKLEQKLATLRVEYLQKHPEVQKTKQELKSVENNIDSEIQRSIDELKNRVQALQRSRKNLKKRLATLNQDIFKLNELGVKYKQLKNKAQNLEKMYESVLTRSSELDLSTLHTQKNVEILEKASIPESPISPSLPLNLVVGLILGLGVGGLSIFVLDSMDKRLKSIDELTYFTEKPILGLLPPIPKADLHNESPDLITHHQPRHAFSEAIKTVRTNLAFADQHDGSTSLLITSPGIAEGKTLVSINLAISTAQSGDSTLLVESDLRRPRIHQALQIEPERGIEDVLAGRREMNEVITATSIENLDLLPCKLHPEHPSELLHSAVFREFVEKASDAYDRIIFDSPPTTSVSDGLIISRCVDGVIILSRFEKTNRKALGHTIEQLQGIDAPIVGLIANDVDSNISGYGYYYDAPVSDDFSNH